MNINTWNSYQEEISKLKAFLNEKYAECRARERESEDAYQIVRAYSNLDQPTLKEFLQEAMNYSNEVEVNLQDFARQGVYVNYKFAEQRRLEGVAAAAEGDMKEAWKKELAAKGVEDEITGFVKMFNYIDDNYIAESINLDRVKVEFVGKPGETKKMNITDIHFVPSNDLRKAVEDNLKNSLAMAGSNLKGTAGIDKLKSIKKITPSLEVFDLGSEMGLTDIRLSMGFDFHHGKDKTTGKIADVVIQNKKTTKAKPFLAAIKTKNARNLKEVFKNSFENVVFFRINGKVYYTSEIIVLFGKEIIKCIENNDEKGFYDLIGGK